MHQNIGCILVLHKKPDPYASTGFYSTFHRIGLKVQKYDRKRCWHLAALILVILLSRRTQVNTERKMTDSIIVPCFLGFFLQRKVVSTCSPEGFLVSGRESSLKLHPLPWHSLSIRGDISCLCSKYTRDAQTDYTDIQKLQHCRLLLFKSAECHPLPGLKIKSCKLLTFNKLRCSPAVAQLNSRVIPSRCRWWRPNLHHLF